MKSLMLLSNPMVYDPRVKNEAETLMRNGHRVTVIGWDRNSEFPSEEVMNGVKVIRLRNSNYMGLLPLMLLRLRSWWRMAYRAAIILSFDVVHCHDLDTLPTGVWLKKQLGVPLIYDAHEIWGYMVAKELPNVLVNHFLRKERHLIKYADAVITVNEPMKEYFEKIARVPVTVVMNAKHVMVDEYEAAENGVFTLLYIGILTESRMIKGLMDAVRGLPVNLIIGGHGRPRYVAELQEKSRRISNVEFIGVVPQEEVLPLTLASDAVVCMTDPSDRNNSIATANKQFEAMACGRPIIVSKGTYPGEFTREHNVGIVVEHSISGLRWGIVKLMNTPEICETLGRRALKKGIEEFNWERQEETLMKVYGGL